MYSEKVDLPSLEAEYRELDAEHWRLEQYIAACENYGYGGVDPLLCQMQERTAARCLELFDTLIKTEPETVADCAAQLRFLRQHVLFGRVPTADVEPTVQLIFALPERFEAIQDQTLFTR